MRTERPTSDTGVFAEAFDPQTEEVPTIESATAEPTAEMPTVETPIGDTAESPTIERPELEEVAGDASLGEDDATAVASLEEARTADATAEIDLDDLGLDLDAMQSSLNDDLADDALADTSRSMTLDADLAETGRNEALEDDDATGTNEAIAATATGLHSAIDETLAATGELPAARYQRDF